LKYVDFKNWQPRPSWLFFFCGTLFLLTSLCGTNEEIFSEFQPSFQCNVCLCVWYVLSVLAQHTPHTFFLLTGIMIGADDILVHYILKSEYAQFQPSRILYLKCGFIVYLRWTIMFSHCETGLLSCNEDFSLSFQHIVKLVITIIVRRGLCPFHFRILQKWKLFMLAHWMISTKDSMKDCGN